MFLIRALMGMLKRGFKRLGRWMVRHPKPSMIAVAALVASLLVIRLTSPGAITCFINEVLIVILNAAATLFLAGVLLAMTIGMIKSALRIK
jgi:hypothetical protein